METVAIGADHAGYRLKEEIRQYLNTLGFSVCDAGPETEDPVDYPDLAARVARDVASGRVPRGVLICGSGAGMAITANKFPGVRAVVCLDEALADLCRRHNDANILVLAGRMTDGPRARSILDTWLNTPFEGGRHQRRLDKVRQIEATFCK